MVNKKGFTLIELLAVITIMGILMIVAIPSVTRTIENSRKDTFIDTVKQYANGVKTMWVSDNLSCSTPDGDFVSSAVPMGMYYVEVDSSSTSVPQVLESGGKSPWGQRDIRGIVAISVKFYSNPGPDGVINTAEKCDATGVPGTNGSTPCVSTDDIISRKITYTPILVDGIHGVNIEADGSGMIINLKDSEKLKRGDLVMSNASYSILANKSGDSYTIKDDFELRSDFNGDGDLHDSFDEYVKESGTKLRKCVEI